MESTYVYDILHGIDSENLSLDNATAELVLERLRKNVEKFRHERDFLTNRGRLSKKGREKLQPFIDAILPDVAYLERALEYYDEMNKKPGVEVKVIEDPLEKTLQGIKNVIASFDSVLNRMKTKNKTLKSL